MPIFHVVEEIKLDVFRVFKVPDAVRAVGKFVIGRKGLLRKGFGFNQNQRIYSALFQSPPNLHMHNRFTTASLRAQAKQQIL